MAGDCSFTAESNINMGEDVANEYSNCLQIHYIYSNILYVVNYVSFGVNLVG